MKFGEAKDRLDAILGELESNEVDVDDLAERVREAAALIRVLHHKLTRTRAEVEKVMAEVADPPSGQEAEAEDRGADGTPSGD